MIPWHDSNVYKMLICRGCHQRCSIKKVFLKLSQNSQEKTCASYKKSFWHRCFPVNFAKFLRTSFSRNNSGRLLLDLVSKTVFKRPVMKVQHSSLWHLQYLKYQSRYFPFPVFLKRFNFFYLRCFLEIQIGIKQSVSKNMDLFKET